jgi:hypothetical protein
MRSGRVGIVLLVAMGLVSLPVQAVIKNVYDKVATTANGTWTYGTSNSDMAQVTIWASTGSPDGTVTVYTRTGTGTATRVQVAQYATPTSTAKTYSGETQAHLDVVVTGLSTGTISFEVVTK